MTDFIWNKVAPAGGWIILFILLGNSALQYGNRWEFGKYGMPQSLVAPDGQHYTDGSLIDPISRQLIALGIEQEAFLLLLAFMIACLVMAASHRQAKSKE